MKEDTALLRKLKDKILANQFVNQVRIELVFDEVAYSELVRDLGLLATELKGKVFVDKELTLQLYTLPLAIRNAYLSGQESIAEIFDKLEDAWIELDDLVTRCLTEDI